ncbi:MAG: hypothetical protein ACRES9_07635 [Gammaproteobacteria bacterium]
MRKVIPMAMSLALALLTAGALAQGASPADQQFFNQHIGDLVKLKLVSLDNPALPKVFSGQFYKVDVIVAEGGTTVIVARQGSELVQMATPSSTADMPGFLKLLSTSFRLESDEDAHKLQDALDVLYPINSDFGGEDAQAKTIKHAGNEWTFVRGKFFEHYKGFVFTTDKKGAVTNVKYSLDIN